MNPSAQASLPSRPFGRDFFFPQGGLLLEFVDEPFTRPERLLSVWTANMNGDNRFLWPDRANSVSHGYAMNAVQSNCLLS